MLSILNAKWREAARFVTGNSKIFSSPDIFLILPVDSAADLPYTIYMCRPDRAGTYPTETFFSTFNKTGGNEDEV